MSNSIVNIVIVEPGEDREAEARCWVLLASLQAGVRKAPFVRSLEPDTLVQLPGDTTLYQWTFCTPWRPPSSLERAALMEIFRENGLVRQVTWLVGSERGLGGIREIQSEMWR